MNISEIAELFGIKITSAEKIKSGHINQTCLVTADNGERYILQSINSQVFRRPETIMANIALAEKAFSVSETGMVKLPHYLTADDKNYAAADGKIWRIYSFAESKSNEKNLYFTGLSFGTFIRLMSGVKLAEEPAIDNFHSYRTYLARLEKMTDSVEMVRYRKLGNLLESVFTDNACRRVIHGDAKTANVIIGDYCTIIDLDTIMNGYAAIDYGDMVRSVCGMKPDMNAVSELTKGYADGLEGLLSSAEIATLYYGILWVTGELAIRYMTDYISKEGYFKGKTPLECYNRAVELNVFLDELMEHEKTLNELIKDIF